MAKTIKLRYLEVDLLRTLAIGMMITHHTVFDMWYLEFSTIHPFEGFWWYWQKITLSLFLVLVGMSYNIYTANLNSAEVWQKQWQRFGQLLGVATCITLVSYLIMPQAPIYFGVIHCIAISMLVLPITQKVYGAPVLICITAALYGVTQSLLPVNTNLLSPFGLYTTYFASTDYVPLIPWLAVIISGTMIARFSLPFMQKQQPGHLSNILSWPGRNSLKIYLIHQPIVLLILYVLFK